MSNLLTLLLPAKMMISTVEIKSQVEQLPKLLMITRTIDPGSKSQLVRTLRSILDRPVEFLEGHKGERASYLIRLIEAYYCLFPRCLAEFKVSQLLDQCLHETVQRLVQIPLAVIEEEYGRFKRQGYNQSLKQLVLAFSRPSLSLEQLDTFTSLTEAECLLALFIQCLRQQLGAVVLLSDRFRLEYRDLLRSICLTAKDPELCQNNVIGWLWEAMKSFDPLKAFGASGHGRPTFEAWVRTVVSNKLADEKRKLLKREADELLFYDLRAVQLFQERYHGYNPAIQDEIDLRACLQLIQVVQTEITDPRIRATTSRLRQRISERLNWSIEHTRNTHQQVRRVLGRYVQSMRSLNVTSTESNQEWIDNYPDVRSMPHSSVQGLDCIVEFLEDRHTPTWVRDWCEKRRTQAEIARELYVSQPTISRCLGREYRLWLYRKFFLDIQTPLWMKRWYETQSIHNPHQRRQLRREIHSKYAQGLCTAKHIDKEIEESLVAWCQRNGIYYLA